MTSVSDRGKPFSLRAWHTPVGDTHCGEVARASSETVGLPGADGRPTAPNG